MNHYDTGGASQGGGFINHLDGGTVKNLGLKILIYIVLGLVLEE